MPFRVEAVGSGNTIDIPSNLGDRLSGVVHIEGNDNFIRFHEGSISEEVYIDIGTRVKLQIGPNCRLWKLHIYTTHDSNLFIGANSSFTITQDYTCMSQAP